MTPTEMHIDALMEKIEDLELKISLMIDPIVFNSMSAEYADHLSRLSDQNKKLEAENARVWELHNDFLNNKMTSLQKEIHDLRAENNMIHARLYETEQLYRNKSDQVIRFSQKNARYREALEMIAMDNIYIGENGWKDEYFLNVKQAREALKGE